MSKGQHNSAHPHPPRATRGSRLDSKIGDRISLERLELLLAPGVVSPVLLTRTASRKELLKKFPRVRRRR